MIPYLTHSIVVPPSPLKYQVLFIGGVHDVKPHPHTVNPQAQPKPNNRMTLSALKADATKR